jgi:hypothetical protein
MKRFIATLAAVGVAMALTVPSAFAGNAHFIKSASSATLSGSTLVCNFKETGLESGSVETVACDATAETTYECVNGGGKNPSASNKTTTVSDVGNTGTFPADKNGNIVGSVRVTPPSASQLGFSCPSGQTVTFVGVTYTDVSVTDTVTGASLNLPGTFSYTNPAAP